MFGETWNEPLSPYDQHKKQAKAILSKIHRQHLEELRRERSQGFQIVDDLKEELRRNHNKHKTQFTQKRIRHRQMSQHVQKCLLAEGGERAAKENGKRRTSLKKQLTLASEQFKGIARRNSKKLSKMQKCEFDEVLQEVVASLNSSQEEQSEEQEPIESRNLQLKLKQKKRLRSQEKKETITALNNYKQNKTFLPMLELYIEERVFLKSMNQQQQRTHSIITQMLILAVNRRKNNKLLDALDVLIQIDSFFPKENKQLDYLKSVWYQLISKLFIEIRDEEKARKANRWRKNSTKKSNKDIKDTRRQRTIVIKSLVSRRNFITRVSRQLQKLELVRQTNYLRQSRNYTNTIEESQNGKVVISRITQNYVLSFPQPAQHFPDEEEVKDYGIVLIKRDKDSNLFPYHYPLSISDHIPQEQYLQTFSKINSVLVPERKCLNFNTSLNIYYEPIFLLFFLFLLTIILVICFVKQYVNPWSVLTMLVIVFFILGILCSKIHGKKSTHFGHSNEIYLAINKILHEWVDIIKTDQVKFKLSQHSDLILISFPKKEQEQSQCSEEEEVVRQSQRRASALSMMRKTSGGGKYFQELKRFMEDQENDTETRRDLESFRKKIEEEQARLQQVSQELSSQNEPSKDEIASQSSQGQYANEEAPEVIFTDGQSNKSGEQIEEVS